VEAVLPQNVHYSAECVEWEFSKVRRHGALRSSPGLAKMCTSAKRH
jgi:hypothetical protein